MSLRLPQPGRAYDAENEARTRRSLEEADDANQKRGSDYEVSRGRLILTDTVTGTRYNLTIASGVVTLTAL